MTSTTPALLLVHKDGTIVDDNVITRQTFGRGIGKLCWEFVGELPNAQHLPCTKGCVSQMLTNPDGARRLRVIIDGRHHWLTCMAAGDNQVACTLHPTNHEQPRLHECLTPRERQVVEGIAAGQPTPELALDLGISPATVRSYVEHMRNKLGVATRAALVARAIRLGIID